MARLYSSLYISWTQQYGTRLNLCQLEKIQLTSLTIGKSVYSHRFVCVNTQAQRTVPSGLDVITASFTEDQVPTWIQAVINNQFMRKQRKNS